MSNYSQITKHPATGEYAIAEYLDDYFMPHVYGVKFPDDEKVYPLDLVDASQIRDFWVEDVVAAFRYVMGLEGKDDAVVMFLNQVQKEYKARWKRDPIRGEGAVDQSVVIGRFMNQASCEHFVQRGECVYCRLAIEDEE